MTEREQKEKLRNADDSRGFHRLFIGTATAPPIAMPMARRLFEKEVAPPAMPVVDGDLPIGLTLAEYQELVALQALALDAPAEEPRAAAAEGEEEESSPVTSHTVARTRSAAELSVKLEKAAGVEARVVLGYADVLRGVVCVRDVKQGSPLLGVVYNGDILLSINGRAVKEPSKGANALTAAGGEVTLAVKRMAGGAESAKGGAKGSTKGASARYQLSFGAAPRDGASSTLLAAV